MMILIAYWAGLLLLSAFFLRQACSLCRTYIPAWPRAVVSTLLTLVVTYLAFDCSAYLLTRSMDGVVIQVPPWYGYHLWFREALSFKWGVISEAGLLRFLPLVFALCAAGTLQVMVLQADVSFRYGVVIVVMQLAATLVAGYGLALALGVVGSQVAQQAQPEGLQVLARQVDDATQARQYAEHAWSNLKAYANTHLADLKEDLAPLTAHLPEPVQRFLDQGGWWGVLALLGVVALFWLRAMLSKLGGAVARTGRKKKKKRKRVGVNLKEDLALIGDAYTDPGPQRITVSTLPARLRLVVLSLGTKSGGELSEAMADRVLDWIKPGLSKASAGDYPRVTVWPFFPSAEGFTFAFAKNAVIPERKGEKSHWVLVSGQVKMGPALLHVGLAFHADEPNSLRHIKVDGEKWLGVIGVAEAPQPARSR